MFDNIKRFLLWPVKVTQSSIRARIVVTIIILTIIPLSVVGIISYSKYFESISKQTTQSVIEIAEQLNNSIEGVIYDTEKFLEVGNSDNVRTFLKYPGETYNEAKNILDLFKIYRNAYKFNPSIKGIYIIGVNGKSISENEGVYFLNHQLLIRNKTFKELIEEPDKIRIISGHISDYSPNANKRYVISIGKTIVQKVTHEIMGVIIIDLDISIIKNLCDGAKIGDTGYFFILNKDRELVFKPKNGFSKYQNDYNWNRIIKSDKGSSIEKINGNKNLIVYNKSEQTGWEIIGQVPLREIMKGAYDVRNITIVILALCLVAVAILLIFISDSLTRPIRRLRHTMKQAEEGNLDVRAEERGTDEIAELCSGFNKMITEIKQLLSDSIREHENLKKSELKVLQSQINPHFLYNTLDAIVWMAEGKENERVIELVNALSKFFRIALSRGRDFINIKDEVEHCRSYLTIQKIRYEDVLDYYIDVSDSLMECRILKLILQPLVENAIYHGIKNKRGGGMVKLLGYISSGDVIFEIIDDGIGIPPEKLSSIREGLNSDNMMPETRERGFGLYNVDRRIKLYYGKEYGVSIDSEYLVGTTVKLIIPMER